MLRIRKIFYGLIVSMCLTLWMLYNSAIKAPEDVRSGNVRHCTTAERLSMIRKYCDQHEVAKSYLQKHGEKNSVASGSHYIDSLPDEKILSLSHELWLDPKNKVIVCMHAKVGCSTWKAILANNVGNTTITEEDFHAIHTKVFQAGMKCADVGKNVTEIRHRLKTWYKIVIVRHPFDRLVSTYVEKLVELNKGRAKMFGRSILHKYHPYLPAKIKQAGTGVTFNDFIQFILDGARNDHINGPYEAKCHACILDYDYVVKLETHDTDSQFIVNHKLQGKTIQSHLNSVRQAGSVLLNEGRNLQEYIQTLSELQLKQLEQRHRSDFGMYGYIMENPTFIAKCSGYGEDGKCC